jgi:CheY-like chemotaxis protein
VLLSEAQEGALATSDIAELAALLAKDRAEHARITQETLEKLITIKMPAGRIEDLRKAFVAVVPPDRDVSEPAKAAVVAIPSSPAAAEALAKSYSSQQTRPLPPAFKVPFDAAGHGSPEPRADVARTAPGETAATPPSPDGKNELMDTGQFMKEWSDMQKEVKRAAIPPPPTGPKAPLPIRGKAAQIMTHGQDAVQPSPAPRSNTISTGRSTAEPVMRRETMHFGPTAHAPNEPQTDSNLKPIVLVADDDNRIRMVFRIKLEQRGFRVHEAPDGQEAWKRIQQGGIQAVVLDMKMPGLHGLEVLQRMSDDKKNIPVVICTAYDRLDDEFVVATYPKLRYLTKPVDPDHLADTLSNLLGETD